MKAIVESKDTLMYLINYSHGWELLSADFRAPVVLLRGIEGNISTDELSDNPAYLFYLRIISALKQDNSESVPISSSSWQKLFGAKSFPWICISVQLLESYEETKDHLLVTKWGQNSPWNSKTPKVSSTNSTHCYAGCGVVAAAQLLYYLHYKYNMNQVECVDTQTNVTIPSGQFYTILKSSDLNFPHGTNLSYAWDIMSPTYAESTSTGQKAVASLMVKTGYLAHAKYKIDYDSSNVLNPSGTSTYTSRIKTVLDSAYHYNCTYKTMNQVNDLGSLLRTQIYLNELPVFLSMSGYSNSSSDTFSHAVVVDGYRKTYKKYLYRYARATTNGTYEYKEEIVEVINQYAAVNWGYDGKFDSDLSGNTIWYSINNDWVLNWSVYYPSSTEVTTYDQDDAIIYGFSVS